MSPWAKDQGVGVIPVDSVEGSGLAMAWEPGTACLLCDSACWEGPEIPPFSPLLSLPGPSSHQAPQPQPPPC